MPPPALPAPPCSRAGWVRPATLLRQRRAPWKPWPPARQARFRIAARRFVVGRGLAQPDGRLRVGKWIELSGLGALFDGKYYLAEVRHRFDGATGFRSEFTAERPGLGVAR